MAENFMETLGEKFPLDRPLDKEKFVNVLTCADRCEEDESHGGVRFFVADALGRFRRIATRAVGLDGPTPVKLSPEDRSAATIAIGNHMSATGGRFPPLNTGDSPLDDVGA